MKHIKNFNATNDYVSYLNEGGGFKNLPKVIYLHDTQSVKYINISKLSPKRACFLRVESDIDGDGTLSLEPLVFDTTGIKSVKINGKVMTDFVPRTTTKMVQTFENIIESTEWRGEVFYETTNDLGDTIYLMNDPKSSSLYIDPDSKFVFGDDFHVDDYYVMLFAKAGIITIVSENYPLSQIIGTQSDLIVEGNVFELSENFKTKLKEYQALGINPVAIPYKITDPWSSDYTLETVKINGTAQILPTEDMFREIELEEPIVIGSTTYNTLPLVELEFVFESGSTISPFMFATDGVPPLNSNNYGGWGSVLSVDKDFYYGLDKIPCGAYTITSSIIGGEIKDNKLILDNAKKYIIPESVTELCNNAIAENRFLEELVIPNSVTKIGNWALYGCSGLKSLTFPKSLTHLGESAIYGCSSLESITCNSRLAPTGFIELLSSLEDSYDGILYHPTGSNYTNWLWGLNEGWVSKAIEDGQDTTDKNRYLCFEPVEDGLVISMINQDHSLYYKIDNGGWKLLSIGGVTEEINIGQKVYFKGESSSGSSGIGTFVFNKKVKASGPVESLRGQQNSLNGPLCFLFKDCVNLIQAPEFAAIELCPQAYYGMFENCSSLTEAPELPSTLLSEYCYYAMFKGCTSLTKAPVLPASKMENFCYAFMFNDCTSLTKAPKLPSKELAISCYNEMFMGCTSLINAPELPAARMQDSCYFGMFVGCTSLETAPVLNAQKLERLCYGFMFQNCTALTNIPEILPATTLYDSCYQAMFLNCSAITKAPELPALRLKTNCYSFMFQNCLNLNHVKAMFLTTPNDSYLNSWLLGVAENGTFIKNPEATWSGGGIPLSWTIETSI